MSELRDDRTSRWWSCPRDCRHDQSPRCCYEVSAPLSLATDDQLQAADVSSRALGRALFPMLLRHSFRRRLDVDVADSRLYVRVGEFARLWGAAKDNGWDRWLNRRAVRNVRQ